MPGHSKHTVTDSIVTCKENDWKSKREIKLTLPPNTWVTKLLSIIGGNGFINTESVSR